LKGVTGPEDHLSVAHEFGQEKKQSGPRLPRICLKSIILLGPHKNCFRLYVNFGKKILTKNLYFGSRFVLIFDVGSENGHFWGNGLRALRS